LEREARPLSNLPKPPVGTTGAGRRIRLGRLKFLFHSDRIDQIAAVTAVTGTDRSKSRWKNQRAKRKRKRSKLTATSIRRTLWP